MAKLFRFLTEVSAVRYVLCGILCVITTIIIVLGSASSAYAATVLFEPQEITTSLDGTFTAELSILPESDAVVSADLYIKFDPSRVTLLSVEHGTHFPLITHSAEESYLIIRAMHAFNNQFVDTKGVLATISGTITPGTVTTLTISCGSQNNTSKVIIADMNATNVLDCANLVPLRLQSSGQFTTQIPSTHEAALTRKESPAPTSILSPIVQNDRPLSPHPSRILIVIVIAIVMLFFLIMGL